MGALPPSAVIGVVGAGAMGAGIAQVAAQAGHTVLLHDARPGAAENGIAQIAAALARQVEKGKLSAEARAAVLARLKPCAALSDFAPARLAVEAIVEDLAAKSRLFAELEEAMAPDAILASNTSSLSLTAIGAALKRPDRLVGMHFFNPAPLMALVEVVSGLATSPDVAACIHDTALAWGKSPVHARSTPGFIVNRVARPFYAEALRVMQEGGADPATLDAVLREAGGFRMGPFELMDLIGHDVNFAVTNSVFQAFFNDPRFLPSLLQQELVEAGWLGRKSGRGFYDYGPEAAPPRPAEAAAAPRPSRVAVEGDLGPAAALAALLVQSGLTVECRDGPGQLRVDGVVVALSDGRSATQRAADDGVVELALFDLALDYAAAPRIAVAAADQSSPRAVHAACGLFQALGKRVSVLADIPGLIVLRTVAMLANEAAEAVHHGVAAPAAIDTAMTKGVNYPLGPLAWAERIGLGRLLAVLDALAAAYGEDRYRASALLRRKHAGGTRFHD